MTDEQHEAYKRGREEAWNELRRAAIAHGGVSNTDTGETIALDSVDLSHVGAELHAKWKAEDECTEAMDRWHRGEDPHTRDFWVLGAEVVRLRKERA
jgi:hypothetical protein